MAVREWLWTQEPDFYSDVIFKLVPTQGRKLLAPPAGANSRVQHNIPPHSHSYLQTHTTSRSRRP
jgi:hypothetical protein